MEKLTLYNSVQSSLIRQALLRGIMFASIGIFFIVFSGILINKETLSAWGFPIFFISLSLIAIGLIPYRRLTRLATKPDALTIIDLDYLEFVSKGKMIIEVPLKDILKLDYIEIGNKYGIGLWVRPEKIENMILGYSYCDQSTKKICCQLKCNFFFPYFTKRSFHELNDWMREDQSPL
ncbi:MAG: hypothetical protein H0W88_00255 [Parachlamydiaceae bacterium]|nr:hypothetical protein [Parachlamydiaceae bacterium]